MKYIDWLIQWLENYVRPSVKVRTYERYRLIIEQHIKVKLGGVELDDLSPLVLQSFITELLQSGNKKTGKGLSANSVNAVISVIQSSLKMAHLLGLTNAADQDVFLFRFHRASFTNCMLETFTDRIAPLPLRRHAAPLLRLSDISDRQPRPLFGPLFLFLRFLPL